jgi:hypothetical protein
MNPFSRRIHPAAVLAIALGLVCITGIVNAQSATRVTDCSPTTPNNAICLVWTHDGKAVDGKPVTGVTYRAQQRNGTAGTFSTIGTGLTVTQLYVENLAPGEYFFRVFANCTGTGCVDSAASNTASRTATPNTVQPTAPILTIAVVIGVDHSPVYRITQEGKRDQRYNDACGFIPVGKACAGPVLFTFRDSRFRRVNSSDVKPWKVDCSGSVAAPCA